MAWSVDWDGAYVVGGDDSRRLTPNFRLREFRRPDGKVRVHRELVSALQILRDRLGSALSVNGTDADGLGANVSGEPAGNLEKTAGALVERGLFQSAATEAGRLHVRIANPEALPEIPLSHALETAFLVTAAFETAGDKFQQVTGNFDGAGLSFGPAQVNFGTGTLPPLFRKFREADEAALRGCFSDREDYAEWLRVLDLPVKDQIAWASNISTGRSGADVIEPWRSYFHAVGRVEKFKTIMVESILREYGARLLDTVGYLEGLCPGVKIDHLRCVCSLWDLVIQQGGVTKAKSQIEARVAREKPANQFDLVRIAVEERGRTALSRFQNDCLSRRLGVLQGVPQTIGDTQRANVMFYMLRDVRVKGAADIEKADVDSEILRASTAVAAGETLA